MDFVGAKKSFRCPMAVTRKVCLRTSMYEWKTLVTILKENSVCSLTLAISTRDCNGCRPPRTPHYETHPSPTSPPNNANAYRQHNAHLRVPGPERDRALPHR